MSDEWTRRYLHDGLPLEPEDAAGIIIKMVEQTGATHLPDEHRDIIAEVCKELWRQASRTALRRVISAAPELARVLLSIEWMSGGVPDTACIVCGAVRYIATDGGARQQGHAPDCALDTALRKAGVR